MIERMDIGLQREEEGRDSGEVETTLIYFEFFGEKTQFEMDAEYLE